MMCKVMANKDCNESIDLTCDPSSDNDNVEGNDNDDYDLDVALPCGMISVPAEVDTNTGNEEGLADVVIKVEANEVNVRGTEIV